MWCIFFAFYDQKAHDNGFEVSLLYVAVSSPELAIGRIKQRVEKGGHGVPDELVRKRFKQSLDNLPKIARIVDNVQVFTNDDESEMVFARSGEKILKNDLERVDYLPNNLPSQRQWIKEQRLSLQRRKGLER